MDVTVTDYTVEGEPPKGGKRKRGGRRAFTPEVQALVLQAAYAGQSRQGCADHAGISESMLYKWLAIARNALERQLGGGKLGKSDQELARFAADMKQADAGSESVALTCVFDAMRLGNWQAAMTYLERRWPERWGKRNMVQNAPPLVNGEGEPGPKGEPLAIDLVRGGAVPLDQLKEELARRGLPTDIFPD